MAKRSLKEKAMSSGNLFYVNLACDPFTPEGWKVAKHQRGGRRVRIELRDGELYLDGKKVVLYLSEHQQNGQAIKGYELREELSGKLVINACLLDFLLKHPKFIPESWGKVVVFFWGTEYEDVAGLPHARYLYRGGVAWRWGGRWRGDFCVRIKL